MRLLLETAGLTAILVWVCFKIERLGWGLFWAYQSRKYPRTASAPDTLRDGPAVREASRVSRSHVPKECSRCHVRATDYVEYTDHDIWCAVCDATADF